MTYTRTNTLILFLVVLALVCGALLTRQLWRARREKRFLRTHPLIHNYNATAESIYQALRENAEDDEATVQRARQWFEDNYDLHKDEP